jgi:hypothetical protein
VTDETVRPTSRRGRGTVSLSRYMTRFAAKLLFQFRVDFDGDSGKRRLCEERIINFSARSSREALHKAKCRGKKGEHSYKNSDGNTVAFEFVGILDLMSLGVEAEADEVWYDIRERLLPKERRHEIIPTDEVLLRRIGGSPGSSTAVGRRLF